MTRFLVLTLAVLSAVCVPAAPEDDAVVLSTADHMKGSARFLPEGKSFSAAFAVKPEFHPNGGKLAGLLLSTGNGWDSGFRMCLRPSPDGRAYFPEVEIGLAQAKKGSIIVTAESAPLKPGYWAHVAFTWDGRTIRFYVNGKEAVAQAYDGPYFSEKTNGVVLLGVPGPSYGLVTYPFVADNVRLWNRTLAMDELKALAKAPTFEPDSPELADAIGRILGGEALKLSDLSAMRKKYVTPPFVLGQLVAGVAFASLAEGDLAKGRQAYAKAQKLLTETAGGKVLFEGFRSNYVEALKRYGHLDEALKFLLKNCDEVAGTGEPSVRAAALELAAAYRRMGRTAEADAIAKRVGPHGRFTAGPQKGASVTSVRPRTSFYVAPDGDDRADGSGRRPFATLERARDAVRGLRASGGLPKGGVAVVLKDGEYRMKKTLSLGAEDSGEPGSPVVWCAADGARPVLTGGWRLPKLGPVTDEKALVRIPEAARGKVRCCSVRDAGAAAFAPVPQYGYYVGKDDYAPVVPAIVDLSCDGRLLTPARYPNRGGWLRTGEADVKTGRVAAEIPTPEKWAAEPELMATGYWRWFWADLTTRVLEIDAKGIRIETKITSSGRSLGKLADFKANQTFFLFNALCALDEPGEWYLDRASGVLYVIPPEGAAEDAAYELTAFDRAFVELKGTHDVRIEGLVFECGARNGVELDGCAETVFAGNVVRGFGGSGMTAFGCRDVTVRDNVFRTFGHGALMVSGGDRKTLTPSGIRVVNNELADVELRRLTYAPHLHVRGVGTEVSNNHFHDAPSSAMRLEGNDFWIVSNLTENVVLSADDQGGVDIYNNASYLGNCYCWNTWKDIGRSTSDIPIGQAGVRFDGNISGQTVFGNRFVRCGTGHFGAVQTCGGRLHVVDNNLFVDCSRGMSITHYPIDMWTNRIFRSLQGLAYNPKGIDVRQPPYATRYTGAETLCSTDQVNHLVRNITVGKTPLLINPPKATVAYANWHFAELPDLKRMERETSWQHIPEESETGPRPTPAFRRAKANDTH